MTAKARVIAANEYRRERWKNDAGWTREIVRCPDNADWQWRLSIAEIEQDGPFSSFDGIDRELVLIHGNGLRLRMEAGEGGAEDEVHELHPPHGRMRFEGERRVHGELLDGPTHDFNLMWRRDAIAAELLLRPLVGPMVFFTEPGTTWAVHLLAGQAKFDDASGLPAMWMGDTALLADGSRQRFIMEGGGEILAIKLTSLSAESRSRDDD